MCYYPNAYPTRARPSAYQAPNQHRGVMTLALSHPPSKPTSFDGDRDVADWAWPISISCAGEQIHPPTGSSRSPLASNG